MGFFDTKKEVMLEDFCRDFYDNSILSQKVGGVDLSNVYPEQFRKSVSEVFPEFGKVDLEKLSEEIVIMRFELFALAWTHKYVNGKVALLQSAFTKRYLHEKGKDNIWAGMEAYNNAIDGGVLHMLSGLPQKAGMGGLTFNYGMRKDLTAKNIVDAQKIGIATDDSVGRENNRLWSEPMWKQKVIHWGFLATLCDRLALNSDELTQETIFRLSVLIQGLYDGAQQSWDKVKIIT